jgi:two-component system, LytTR family, sensor kinase
LDINPAPAGLMFLLTMFKHRYRYAFITALAVYTFINTELCEVYFYFHLDIAWYYALLTIFLITFLVWESSRLVEPFLLRKFDPQRNKIRFLAAFFIAGNIAAVLSTLLIVGSIGMGLHKLDLKENMVPLKLNLIYAGLVNLFFHLINAILFFFKEYHRQWAEAEELRRNSTQAQLQLIKNQVNPHFLFNNLNVLSSLVIQDNPEANKFIEEFSKVYRYILNNQEKELVELQHELDFIKPYIFLLQKRFDYGLQVELNIPESYKDKYVIPVALQMLIENAIKHNVVSRARPLHIEVHVNGDNTLVVRNNLQPKATQEISTQIGLQNIRKRYELICGKTVTVDKTDTDFTVSLPLLHLN